MDYNTLDSVKKYHNFLEIIDFNEAYKHLNKPKWNVQCSDPKFEEHKIFWKMSLVDEKFFTHYLFVKIQKYLRSKYIIKDVYANGQTFGQSGSIHQDSVLPNHETLLIYMNTEWDINWGGETVFLDHESKDTKYFLPDPNAALLFPSNLYHFAKAPTKEFYGIRYTIAYKLEKINV